jgi:hypothetical protein
MQEWRPMPNTSDDPYDRLLDALYNMVDALDDMWWEEEYYNVREVWKIKDERYHPAREAVKQALRDVIRQEIGRLS